MATLEEIKHPLSDDNKTHPFDDVTLEKKMDDLLDENIPAWVENGPATYRLRAGRWLWNNYQTPKSIQEEVDAYHARNRFSQFFYWLFNINDIAWKVQWQIHQDIVRQIEKDKKASKEGSIEISESFRPYIKFLNPSSIPSVWQRGWNNILSSVMTWWNGLFQPQQNKKKIVDQPQVQADPGDPMLLRAPYIKPRVPSEKKGKTLLTEIQQQDFYYLCGFFGLTPERVIESGLTEYCDALSSFGNQAVQNDMKVRLQRAAQLSSTLKKLNLSYSYSLVLDLNKNKKEAAIKQGNDDRLPATSIKMLTDETVEKKEEKEKEEKIAEAPLIQLNESESIQVATILGLFFKTRNEIEAKISPSTAEFTWNINDEIPSDVFKKRYRALQLIVHPDKKREHIIPTLTLSTVDNAYKNFQQLCGGNKRIRLVQNNEAVVNAYEEARKQVDPSYETKKDKEWKKRNDESEEKHRRNIAEIREKSAKEIAALERKMAEQDEKAEKEIAALGRKMANQDEKAEKEIVEMEKKLEEEKEITKKKEAELTDKSRRTVQSGVNFLKKGIESEKEFFPKEIIKSMLEKITQIENIIPTASQEKLLDVVSSQLSGIVRQFREEKQKIIASQHMSSDTKSTATEAPTPTPSPAPVTIASPNSHIHGLFDAMASVPTTTPPPVLKEEEKQNHRESNAAVTQVLH